MFKQPYLKNGTIISDFKLIGILYILTIFGFNFQSKFSDINNVKRVISNYNQILFSQSCLHYPYDSFLRKTGISIKFFRLQWHTTIFNRTMTKFKHFCPKLLSKSFDIGVYVSLILLPFVIVGLVTSIFHTSNKNQSSSMIDNVKIEIALPFITLPIEEVPFYIIALGINSIFHELGHGISASLENVQCRGFGIHIIFLIPYAYVELDADQMSTLNIWKRLKILCSGVWHNIIVGMISYLLLISIPQLAASFYNLNDSVIVTSIRPKSPVGSAKGLHNHDIIKYINDCQVKNLKTWYSCLNEAAQYQPNYCLTSEFVQENDESVMVPHNTNQQVIECCDPRNSKVNCFEHVIENFDDDLEVPQYLCLDIRKTIEHSLGFCSKKHKCTSGLCFKPLLDNTTTILQVKRWYQEEDMIYLGHPSDFSRTVKVSEFVPKTNWLSAQTAENLSLFLRYLIVFSFGLALLNVVPCFGFDGQYLVNTLVNNFTADNSDKRRRDLFALGINTIGSLLLFVLVTKAIWTSILSKIM